MKRAVAALSLVALAGGGAARASREAPCGGVQLVPAAESLSLDFGHLRGGEGARHLPETMGSGLAWLDFDGDGWWDLYLVQSGPFPPGRAPAEPGRLFRNVEGRRFVDVTTASGAGAPGYGQGAAAADVDGDGDTDLLVTRFGGVALLGNDGDGTFTERAHDSGLTLPGWSSSAAFADADADGDLDLYVTRYLEYDPALDLFCGDPETGERGYCAPWLFEGAGDRFFRNRGDGTFEDATLAAGIAPADGRGLGVLFTDLDGDGAPDLYVANDLTVNFLFRNRGDGTFEDLSLASGAAVNRHGQPEAGMGLAVGDVDGDLDPDLAVTNFDVETNTLYQNLGGMTFEDVAASSGFGPPSFNLLAFGIAALDLDRDGDLDYYLGNGHIFERPSREGVTHTQRDQVLLGDGRGRFEEVRCAPLEARQTVARGLAAADFDNDGDPDLALQESGGPAALLRNDVVAGRWLGVSLRGRSPNTAGVGAVALLRAGEGAQVRWVVAGDSYQSSSDGRPLFGLPAGSAAPELEVRWPSGRRVRLAAPALDRRLVLPEPGTP